MKVNLTADSHEDVKFIDSEITAEKGYSDKISDWMHGIARTDFIHPDDLGKYLHFTDIENLREAFRKGNTYISAATGGRSTMYSAGFPWNSSQHRNIVMIIMWIRMFI